MSRYLTSLSGAAQISLYSDTWLFLSRLSFQNSLLIYIPKLFCRREEMLLLLTGTADLSRPSEVTSPLCDGLMPFVGLFP